MKTGISEGGCWPSESIRITASPAAALKPADRAASLPKLREKPDVAQGGIAGAQLRRNRARRIGAAVVDNDDLVTEAGPGQHLSNRSNNGGKPLALIVRRQDGGDERWAMCFHEDTCNALIVEAHCC